MTDFIKKSAFLSIAVSLNSSLDIPEGLIHIIKICSNEFGCILSHFVKKILSIGNRLNSYPVSLL